MTPKQLDKHFTSIKICAYLIDYNEESVRQWHKKGVIPYKAQRVIELVTGGKLKAVKKPSKKV